MEKKEARRHNKVTARSFIAGILLGARRYIKGFKQRASKRVSAEFERQSSRDIQVERLARALTDER